MTLEEYAFLAEIVGVVLVIASLIYVAMQLRQNTDAIRAQSRQSLLTASQAELYSETENPEIVVSIIKSGALTPEESIKVSSWLFASFRTRQFAWLQHRGGIIDDAQWQTEVAVIRFYFDSQRVRDWWAKLGRVAFGDEYADFIDSQISAHPATDSSFQTVANWTSS